VPLLLELERPIRDINVAVVGHIPDAFPCQVRKDPVGTSNCFPFFPDRFHILPERTRRARLLAHIGALNSKICSESQSKNLHCISGPIFQSDEFQEAKYFPVLFFTFDDEVIETIFAVNPQRSAADYLVMS
jgi:hypothetical protein